MNLKAFNTENCARKINGHVALHVNRSGSMCFSKAATDHMKLHPEAMIEFFLDETSGQWYVCKTENEKAFPVRKYSEKTVNISSATVASLLMQASKSSGKSARFLIGKEPILHGGGKPAPGNHQKSFGQ